MFSFLIIFLGLSVLIVVHELGHFFVAKLFHMPVDEFGFGLPPRAWGKKIGETVYSLNWLPFGGFVKLYGEEGGENVTMWEKPAGTSQIGFNAEPAWKRSLVILAGVIMNFILGWLLISAVLIIGTPAGIIIAEVKGGSPAALAGLEAGDRVVDFKTSEDFIKFVKDHSGTATAFTFQRGNQTLEKTLTPRVDPPPQEGALGVALTDGGGKMGFFEGLWQGFQITGEIIKATFVGLYGLLRGIFIGQADLTGVVGPIGIFGYAEKVGGLGTVYLLQLLALISINLGVINAVPFPALDGGRFLFILLEKIKGSPLSAKTERVANGIGFVFLIFLMVAISVRDVVKLL
ncbi:MAG: RIP metalloprotease RseP [bacterium]|nr:RIP metalloprotease RseP [bacterium]